MTRLRILIGLAILKAQLLHITKALISNKKDSIFKQFKELLNDGSITLNVDLCKFDQKEKEELKDLAE